MSQGETCDERARKTRRGRDRETEAVSERETRAGERRSREGQRQGHPGREERLPSLTPSPHPTRCGENQDPAPDLRGNPETQQHEAWGIGGCGRWELRQKHNPKPRRASSHPSGLAAAQTHGSHSPPSCGLGGAARWQSAERPGHRPCRAVLGPRGLARPLPQPRRPQPGLAKPRPPHGGPPPPKPPPYAQRLYLGPACCPSCL